MKKRCQTRCKVRYQMQDLPGHSHCCGRWLFSNNAGSYRWDRERVVEQGITKRAMQECKKVWTQVWRKIQQEDYIRHVDVDQSALRYSNKYSMSVVRNADFIFKITDNLFITLHRVWLEYSYLKIDLRCSKLRLKCYS